MNPTNPLPALACLFLAIATAFLLMRRFGAPPTHDRFASIDGLRGYLAFFVFLHHACIWYFFLHTGNWVVPPSALYTHFGQSSVALFFMITGFLFFSKLIDGRTRKIDWLHLYVSRLLRLVPLYLFAMLLLFVIVAVLSNGVLVDSPAWLIKSAAKWIAFTIPGGTDLNGVANTSRIVAGVTWSLPYEWYFYFSLPLLALLVGVTSPVAAIAVCIVGAVALKIWPTNVSLFEPFLGGILAAFAVRIEAIRTFAQKPVASVLVIACVAVTVFGLETAYSVQALVLLTVAFALIASGASLFGALTWSVSRFLGEQAYSLYLLHGILLFTAFKFAMGLEQARACSPFVYWSIIAGLTPILITFSCLTFRFIEQPCMNQSKPVSKWLRKLCVKQIDPLIEPGGTKRTTSPAVSPLVANTAKTERAE